MTKTNKKNKKQAAKATKQQEEDKSKKQDAFDKNYQKHQKNEEVIWHENNETRKATTAWTKIPEKDRKVPKPYNHEDLFKEGDTDAEKEVVEYFNAMAKWVFHTGCVPH